MNALDKQVLLDCQTWLNHGKSVWLCTILSTYGSAPRPIGSLFATEGSIRSGSVSGGCIEDAFMKLIQQHQLDKPMQVFDYGSHLAADGSRYELPCGGHISLLIEYLQPNINYHWLNEWLTAAMTNNAFVRLINIESEQRCITTDLDASSFTTPWLTVHYQQHWQLLLLGISQVSEEVARLAVRAGFAVRLCDMRDNYQQNWRWTSADGGIDVEWCAADDFVERYANDYTAVLALAHDPRVDDLGLMGALESSAFYIGALGSQANSERRRERLMRIGEYKQQQLARLHAPIGVAIGSKTPIEIAIAIMAEVIAAKNGIECDSWHYRHG
ncbi:XdhC family protein [Photobacterium kishitanii]|uniref:XdhC family protein n=1 Tax=Photobacterium kishitanii TaxID=318456 RepID=A0AAX0YT24_9GAMM|nr:XdhC family protein [Photobacterium kishitanii]KJG10027.1 xanthine dehydrogenase [Photobacterium kishitanii]KJG58303.1 xanthine dehydrogenase [Photobacterium kishitanii]KJG61928.1 xanthine dehydrogenase [Photobacterium kishitanii]KJG66103.1 xanthine dehydrogenase [Photobacterium kishitanii]KJG69920.1 xanthine dehydrogenase [Photobacterium kishitanii]